MADLYKRDGITTRVVVVRLKRQPTHPIGVIGDIDTLAFLYFSCINRKTAVPSMQQYDEELSRGSGSPLPAWAVAAALSVCRSAANRLSPAP
jgi:hypothetical protein